MVADDATVLVQSSSTFNSGNFENTKVWPTSAQPACSTVLNTSRKPYTSLQTLKTPHQRTFDMHTAPCSNVYNCSTMYQIVAS